MRALTLTQPWASLVVLGEKRVETRSWAPGAATVYPERIAIHAAKGYTQSDAYTFCAEPFRLAFDRHGIGAFHALPRGAILGTAELAKVARIDAALEAKLSPQERAFGGYAPGRFAWALVRPARLRVPIPLRGALGLFALEPDVTEALERGLRGEANAGELVCTICGGALDGGHMGEECPNETQADEDARHAREEADREAFEERAAIREFDGGLARGGVSTPASRAEAERLAREDTIAARARSGAAGEPGESGRGASTPRGPAAPSFSGPRDASSAPRGDPGECRSCGAPIFWTVTAEKKRAPWDPDGKSHFATCPNANAHRKPRETAATRSARAKANGTRLLSGGDR